MKRDFKKLKSLEDYSTLDAPELLWRERINAPDDCMILRMLVRPKYGEWYIPKELNWLASTIKALSAIDRARTKIRDSWCYVTVRSGPAEDTADVWHFDGGSLRTELIPERNYVWVSDWGFQYKTGNISFPDNFDPVKHDMFSYVEHELRDSPVMGTQAGYWYLVTPFCFHRRNPESNNKQRVFIRISFVDIEIRDINCTQNPLIKTEAFGRDPVKSFRDNLEAYK